MKTKTLFRAGTTDILTGPTAFATKRSVAKEYLDNPGFGGGILYKTIVEYEDDQVLDVRDESDSRQLNMLVLVSGKRHPGAMPADSFVMQDRIAASLVEHGFRWVRLLDTFPKGSETWVYLYDGEDPDLEEI